MMDVNFRCPVCLSEMLTPENEPRMLPLCGHTLCLDCLEKLLNTTKECPLCRTKYLDHQNKRAFPKNYYISPMIEDTKSRLCDAHASPLDLVCITCKVLLCNKCYLKSAHQQHDVEVVDDFYKEVSTRVNEIGLWVAKLKQSKQKDEEYFTLLHKNTLKSVDREFDIRIEMLRKQKDEFVKRINNFFLNIKEKQLYEMIDSESVNSNRISMDNRKQNLSYVMEIYNLDMNEKIKRIKERITEDHFTKMLQDASKLSVKFKDHPEKLVEKFCELKMEKEYSNNNIKAALCFLADAIADRDPIESARIYKKSIEYSHREKFQETMEVFRKITDIHSQAGDTSAISQLFNEVKDLEINSDGEKSIKEYLGEQIETTQKEQMDIVAQFYKKTPKSNKFKAGLKGMKRTNKIASMNAVLECLGNIPKLTEFFFMNDKIIEKYKEMALLSSAYVKLLRRFWLGKSVQTNIPAEEIENVIANFISYPNLVEIQTPGKLASYLVQRFIDELNLIDKKPSEMTNMSVNLEAKLRDLFFTDCTISYKCANCLHIEREMIRYSTINPPLHSDDYVEDYLYFLSKDTNKGTSDKITFNLPSNTNYNEILSKVARTTHSNQSDLIVGLELNDRSLVFIDDTKDVLYVQHSQCKLGFIYEIPNLEEVERKNAVLVRLYLFNDKGIRVGRPQVILIKKNETMKSLAIGVYKRMRFFLHVYFTKKNIKNCIDMNNPQNIENEYEELSSGTEDAKLIYDIIVKSGIRTSDPEIGKITKDVENQSILSFVGANNGSIEDFSLQLVFHSDIDYGQTSLLRCENEFELEEEYCLKNALEHFTRKERLPEDQVKVCTQCSQKQVIYMTRDIIKLPDVLVFYANKYEDKKMKVICIPHKLNLEDFVPVDQKAKAHYVLNSICCKSRSNQSFFAYARNPIDKKWYKFTDSEVVEHNMSEDDFRDDWFVICYSRE